MDEQPVTAGFGAPATGSMIADRYRMTGRIGRGGMADVYSADDVVLHRPVAIKMFRTDTGGPDERARIESEVRTLARLRHPGLVTVFDAGAIDTAPGELTPYLVMELVSGPNLGQHLTNGPLGHDHAALLAAELAATLAYVHGQGIVHRDVKPANILLDAAGGGALPFRPKLTDFGIARLLDATRVTSVGMTIGTANYLSPEQATGRPTEGASDIYSLGLVLIECLTGQVVYPGTGVEAAASRLHRQPELPSSLGPRWIALLTAMTARDPAERPTADEVAAQASLIAGQPATEPWAIGDDAGIAADPTQAIPAGGADSSTRVMPAVRPSAPPPAAPRSALRPATAGHGPWPRPSIPVLVLLGGLAVAIILLIGYLLTQHSGGGTTAPPNYPAVSGSIGSHLRQLEGAVG